MGVFSFGGNEVADLPRGSVRTLFYLNAGAIVKALVNLPARNYGTHHKTSILGFQVDFIVNAAELAVNLMNVNVALSCFSSRLRKLCQFDLE